MENLFFLDFGFGLGEGLPGINLEFGFYVFKFGTCLGFPDCLKNLIWFFKNQIGFHILVDIFYIGRSAIMVKELFRSTPEAKILVYPRSWR